MESRDLLTEDSEYKQINSSIEINEEKFETSLKVVEELDDLPETTESFSESETANNVVDEEEADTATEKTKPEVSPTFDTTYSIHLNSN